MNKILTDLSGLPDRSPKPRTQGLNVIYDYGIPLGQLESFFAYKEHIDAFEIGPGSVFCAGDLQERVALCKKHGITPFLSGIVFELLLVRNKFDRYVALCKENDIEVFQVGDSCMPMPHTEKCGYIEKLAKLGTVYSRVGSHDAAHVIPPYKWIELMQAEMKAGSVYVFAEGREAGNVGIYRGTGELREGLIQEILTHIPDGKIVWDAPQISQQLYFVELLGANCNLSRIRSEMLLALESMRLGLNPRTFYTFLDQKEAK